MGHYRRVSRPHGDQSLKIDGSAGMKLPFRKLLMALAFGVGASAAPATIIVLEAAKTPRPRVARRGLRTRLEVTSVVQV